MMTELEELEARVRLRWVDMGEAAILLMEVISQSEAIRQASWQARIEVHQAVSQSAKLRAESKERRDQYTSRRMR